MDSYLRILEESLCKKNTVLDKILTCSKKQDTLLREEKLDLEAFDKLVDEKDTLVDELTKLDEGFEVLYAKVSEELKKDRALYKDNIARMQKSIGEITDKSVEIRALEERNKASLEKQFQKERKNLRTGRQSSKAAYDYYRNMTNGSITAAQFLDQKN